MIKLTNRARWIFVLLFLLSFGSIMASNFSTLDRDKILLEYFPPKLVQRMHRDALPILKRYKGINVFSSCQYGDVFVTGKMDIGDVFDARIPQNMDIFKRYARDHILILNTSEKEHYNQYSLAAYHFLREYRYDVVLFYPDEFNPVFTTPYDCWMFVFEEPLKKGKDNLYYSKRIKNRRIAVEGGIPLEPLNLISLPQFYIPTPSSSYSPFKLTNGEEFTYFKEPAMLNPYDPPMKVSEEICKKREMLGIIPSPLSHRKGISVGIWMNKADAYKFLKYGIFFGGDKRKYTWSDCGFYTLPLEDVFWKNPNLPL